jgi:hypothetical protein
MEELEGENRLQKSWKGKTNSAEANYSKAQTNAN